MAEKNGRGGEIRTHDLLYPKQARYQATLRPDPGQEKLEALEHFCKEIIAKPTTVGVWDSEPFEAAVTWSLPRPLRQSPPLKQRFLPLPPLR